MIDLEEKRLYEDTITKRRHEQGKACDTTPMEYAQVDYIIMAITTTATASEVQLKKQPTKGFGEVNTELSSLVDAIL